MDQLYTNSTDDLVAIGGQSYNDAKGANGQDPHWDYRTASSLQQRNCEFESHRLAQAWSRVMII